MEFCTQGSLREKEIRYSSIGDIDLLGVYWLRDDCKGIFFPLWLIDITSYSCIIDLVPGSLIFLTTKEKIFIPFLIGERSSKPFHENYTLDMVLVQKISSKIN